MKMKKNIFGALFVTVLISGFAIFASKGLEKASFTKSEHIHSGYHYDCLLPTEFNSGHLEYWTCCECQKAYLNKPNIGNFVDKEMSYDVIGEDNIAYLPAGECKLQCLYDAGTNNLEFRYTSSAFGSVCPLNAKYSIPWPYSQNLKSIKSVTFNSSVKFLNNLESTYNMFFGMSSLECIHGLEYLDTSSVNTTENMFSNCPSLTSIDLTHFNTSNVTNMNRMFFKCESLTSLDLSSFDTGKCESLDSMFCNCLSLTSLDLSNFDTSKITGMSLMFHGCEKLEYLNVSSFDTSLVTNFDSMFYGCSALKKLDFSNFNTESATNMESMFESCHSLEELNISSFNTEKVTDLSYMFYNCYAIPEIDVSSFDLTKVSSVNVTWMFDTCTNLKVIYATDKFTNPSFITNSPTSFDGSNNLKGFYYDSASQQCKVGFAYDSSKTGIKYLRLCTGEGEGGYLTDIKLKGQINF